MSDKQKCSCYGGFDCSVCNPEKYLTTKAEMEKLESDVEKTIPHILDFGKAFKDHHEYIIGLERELQDAKSKSASAYMELEKAMARMMEIKMKQASLIAAINTAITEHPSNQAGE